MNLASFSRKGRPSVGLVCGEGLIDAGARLRLETMIDLLESGRLSEVRRLMRQVPDYGWDDVDWLPPVPTPAHIFCVGTNYADHLAEVQQAGIARPVPKYPAIFTRYPETLVAHNTPLRMPEVSTELDFEAELAVVIGRSGRYIKAGDAMSHVAGYACFNDGSVRDWQFHSHQVTPGKNFLMSGAFGPWLTTADAIEDAGSLDIQFKVNGSTLQHSNTRHLIFPIPSLIAYISSFLPLKVGDVIATGTPAGVGFSRQPPLFLKSGDTCEIHIAGVGVLRNTVTDDGGR